MDGEKYVKCSDFFLGPKKTVLKEKELLKEIRIPVEKLKGISDFRMIGKRNGQTISQVNAAVWVDIRDGIIKDIRIAAGSVARYPCVLLKLNRL